MPRNRTGGVAHYDSALRQSKRALERPRASLPARKHALIGSAALLVLFFCAYRLFTFVPQPLDSPSTLRPILYRFFSNFIKHYPDPEQAQQAWASYCIVALFIPAILILLNYISRSSVNRPFVWVHKAIGSRLLLFISVAACLVVCRFPILLGNEINPDETLFIAAAHKLFKDPIFFRAVDCGTTGPVNIFPLMLPALFGISPDYASTRVIALLLILASIYVIYRALSLLTDEGVARIAILPAAEAFACLKKDDLLYYTSEHVSFLLLSLAFYVCVRIFRSPQSHAWRLGGAGPAYRRCVPRQDADRSPSRLCSSGGDRLRTPKRFRRAVLATFSFVRGGTRAIVAAERSHMRGGWCMARLLDGIYSG